MHSTSPPAIPSCARLLSDTFLCYIPATLLPLHFLKAHFLRHTRSHTTRCTSTATYLHTPLSTLQLQLLLHFYHTSHTIPLTLSCHISPPHDSSYTPLLHSLRHAITHTLPSHTPLPLSHSTQSPLHSPSTLPCNPHSPSHFPLYSRSLSSHLSLHSATPRHSFPPDQPPPHPLNKEINTHPEAKFPCSCIKGLIVVYTHLQVEESY